jgi:hypothetical protein
MNFADGNPKVFLGTDERIPSFARIKGSAVLSRDAMIVGSEEADMMKEEGLIQNPGDILKDFFGVPVMRIAGIGRRTGTDIDGLHIMSRETLARISGAADIRAIPEENDIEWVYIVHDNSFPEQFRALFTKTDFRPVRVDDEFYQPIFLGSTEGKMMITEGVFSKVGDVTDDFFGQKAVLAGILPETKTMLDMFHFIGSEFDLDR